VEVEMIRIDHIGIGARNPYTSARSLAEFLSLLGLSQIPLLLAWRYVDQRWKQ
jgi:hypothetical protein